MARARAEAKAREKSRAGGLYLNLQNLQKQLHPYLCGRLGGCLVLGGAKAATAHTITEDPTGESTSMSREFQVKSRLVEEEGGVADIFRQCDNGR